ncbi:MAG: glutamate--tRNA ligase [Erysipelotrichaceae bacterium]|jgi:nondiscriminating glutamyl-tRNA synthetase|nr:glutamate--tRNA ligase [Bacillota bacterium]MDY0118331.1 glutamate--tRNA ligase [Bacilli bacterium]NLJ32236.1 glutamate--tRNA ligase [Erysipelotrichaceae bacterium]HOF65636.1 glutamate--tRNA ligase [Bacilli bacterium]
MKKIRVRYAPSPTGYLHIGGARSALYNYLFAKHFNGEFVLRIEDTDIERNVEGAEESQINDLIWLGIIPDESPLKPNPKYAPYRQMEKIDVYQKYAKELIDKGYAYYCYCTEEELEAERQAQQLRGISAPQYNQRCLHLTKEEKETFEKEGRVPCIRLHLKPHHEIAFNDLVRGPVKFNNDDIGDWVIIKSNGIPTYNFAVVIDDHMMEITHVLRGEEHLSNTPKQIQLYEYFNWEIPEFGHMTLIVNETGKKLSKRDLNILQFMSQYRDKGYLPEAIMNFILLLGWSPEGEQEIFTLEEAVQIFDPKRLSKSPSMFDQNKLNWMNGQYIKKLDDEKYLELIKPFLAKVIDINTKEDSELLLIANLFKDQILFGEQIIDLLSPLVVYKKTTDEEEIALMNDPLSKEVYHVFARLIAETDELSTENIKAILKQTQIETGAKGKSLFMPIRLILTGETHGPELVNIIKVLGKKEILNRLNAI